MKIIFDLILSVFVFSPSFVKAERNKGIKMIDATYHVQCHSDIIFPKGILASSAYEGCKRLVFPNSCLKGINCEFNNKKFPKTYTGPGSEKSKSQLYEYSMKGKKYPGKLDRKSSSLSLSFLFFIHKKYRSSL